MNAYGRALCHPVRATIHQHVHAAAEPVPLLDLAKMFDVELAVVRHHARVLDACALAVFDGGALSRPG